jgi:hypothetical protein
LSETDQKTGQHNVESFFQLKAQQVGLAKAWHHATTTPFSGARERSLNGSGAIGDHIGQTDLAAATAIRTHAVLPLPHEPEVRRVAHDREWRASSNL